MSKYSEKLKDPRWQKKRLKIFERDEWRCVGCSEITKTLHVHHLKYTKSNPWEEPLKNLATYCEDCHLFEKEFKDLLEFMNDNYSDGAGYDFNDYDHVIAFIWNFFNYVFSYNKLSNPLNNYDAIWNRLFGYLGIRIDWIEDGKPTN